MPVILVVDDSETDRVLVRGLLDKQPLDWVVEFVKNAEDAVAMLDDSAIDLVLTDMMMPGMSGLELVDIVRKRSCPIPVILMSGQGNESLAVEALQKGASSYVPKDAMTTRLVETIKQVLEAQASMKSYGELLENNVQDIRYRFRLQNDPALIPPVVNLLQELAAEMMLLSDEDRPRFGVALDEAIINAMYHGNLELSAEELPGVRASLRDGNRVDAIESRGAQEPFSQRRVHVEALLSNERLDVTIRDDGGGFSHELVDGEQGHRGLTLIKNLVDEVSFNESGNEIRLVKFKKPVNDD